MDKKFSEVKNIPIDKIIPNDWNTNKMSDKEFNRLVKEIEEVGFIDYPQVVPIEDEKYVLIGGEHRHRAARVCGYTELPCVVLSDKKWDSVELRKFISLRLNVIHGGIDPEKFVVLYEEMSKKYGDDILKDLMGFVESKEWNKLTSGIKAALKGSGMDKDSIKEFDDSAKELKTIDGLSSVLNKIFNEYGDTLQHNFVSFNFGTKSGVYVMCEDERLYDNVLKLIAKAKKKKIRADTAIGKFLNNWEKIGIDDLVSDIKEDKEPEGAGYDE